MRPPPCHALALGLLAPLLAAAARPGRRRPSRPHTRARAAAARNGHRQRKLPDAEAIWAAVASIVPAKDRNRLARRRD